MLAVCLTFVLTAFITAVGVGLFLLISRRFGLTELLLSPAMGVAALLISVVMLGKLFPVEAFAWPLAAAWLAFLGFALTRVKNKNIEIGVTPLEAAAALALHVTGIMTLVWPMFAFDFDWLSHSNDDMMNYTLSASYYLHHAYLTFPDGVGYLNNHDLANKYWFLEVYAQERVGVDYLLAFVFAITKLPATLPFMPLIGALYGALVTAAVGMVLMVTESRRATLFAGVLMAFSALSAFGASYQLLGQQAGIALLCLATAFAHRLLTRASVEDTVPAGIAFGALGLAYPEVFPFLALGMIVQYIVHRSRAPLAALKLPLAGVTALCLVFWNIQVPQVILLLMERFGSQTVSFNVRAAYQKLYFVPSGIPSLFGLTSLATQLGDPWLSVLILIGIVLLPVLLYCALRQTLRGNTMSCVFLTMVLVAVSFFVHRSGFALFKVAMYCQPYLVAIFALAAALVYQQGGWKRAGALGFIGFLVLANAVTQHYYITQSMTMSHRDNAYLQIRGASSTRLADTLLAQAAPERGLLLSDTENPSLGKLEGVYSRGAEILYLSWDMINSDSERGLLNPFLPLWELKKAEVLQRERMEQFKLGSYHVPDPHAPGKVSYGLQDGYRFGMVPDGETSADNVFQIDHRLSIAPSNVSRAVLTSGPPVTSLNIDEVGVPHVPLAVVPLNKLRNHLVYLRSALGGMYLENLSRYVGLYQYEDDYFGTGGTMGAMGRHLAFNVLHPSDSMRFVLDITNSVRSNNAELPKPIVIGTTSSAPLLVYGRGSARIISPPIAPMWMDGQSFVALDLNQEPVALEQPRTGLMRLFGNDIPMDPRRFVVYTRGISAISEADYQKLRPPTEIKAFPQELVADPGLEYSGIYEDGWASEDFAVRLRTIPGRPLVIEGIVPKVDDPAFTTEASVFVDGLLATKRRLGVGSFSIEVPSLLRPTVVLHVCFSRVQHLPGEDHRIASMYISRIGASSSKQGPAELGSGWYPTERYAGETFHWMPKSAELQTQSDAPGDLALDVAPGPGVAHLPAIVEVSGEGGAPIREQIAARTTLHIPVAAGARTIHLRVLNGGRRIASDARILDMRAFSLNFSQHEVHAAATSKA